MFKFKVCLLRTMIFSTILGLILHPACLLMFANNFNDSKYKKYATVMHQLISYLRTTIIVLLVTIAINVILARIFKYVWLIKINTQIRDVMYKFGLVEIESDYKMERKRQAKEIPDLVAPSEDELQKMIAYPQITFHHFFRDLWKHRAENPNASIKKVGNEAARKWNLLSREERLNYKSQLKKRLCLKTKAT